MKKHNLELQLINYYKTLKKINWPIKTEVTVQWGDMDAFSHVNNVIYIRWFETARIEIFREMWGDKGINLQEILNISIDKPNGTARFESMGGAFGALGGDLSAINVNPASSSVFNDNEYGLTLGSEKKSNKSLLFNNSKLTKP